MTYPILPTNILRLMVRALYPRHPGLVASDVKLWTDSQSLRWLECGIQLGIFSGSELFSAASWAQRYQDGTRYRVNP